MLDIVLRIFCGFLFNIFNSFIWKDREIKV